MEGTSAKAASPPFPIVGVGASAGGLEAFTQMLSALPVDTGMAFVLVQHLAPTHSSLLADILSRTTAMPVTEVADGLRVQPNRVYVIPPDRNMILSRGILRLLPREEAHGQYRPIDFFLRTLAAEQGHRAIGVILSGTATDGTRGLEAIKAEGGITFAQDDSAQQSSMPQSAVASGCVDFVLPPSEIAQEIGRIARHPYVAPPRPERRKAPAGEQDLGKILEILRKVTGVDFSLYKASTLHRRISRRMVLHKMQGLPAYARFLRKNRGEVEALYQDILINVTRFFRNPETFEALKATVLPKLFKNRSGQEPLRVWVPGCATGEEAYSIAISLTELTAATGSRLPVQVFATDLNEECIDKARAGVYSQNITHDVSPERLQRFFAEVDGRYHISKPIRDMCVFARHNLLTDPPFSQIDLISCRNLLIYLEPALQQKLVPRLHYALKPAGFLLLGSSETIGTYRNLFATEDARHKIYAKKAGTHRATLGRVDRGDVQTEADRTLFLFEELSPSPPIPLPRGNKGRAKASKSGAKAAAGHEAAELENAHLLQELAVTREYLQSVIEQQETANEELQSANEEVQSANEELQSINEELETSKEEIQSSNEELATINEELQNRNLELNQLNNELRRAREYAESIVATVREPLLVLDADLCVQTASRSFYATFQVTPEETEGRFLYDLGEGQWDIPELRRLLEGSPQDNRLDGYEVAQEFEHIGRKTMLLNARRLFQESGQSSLTLLAIEDITARKQLETALRQRVEDLAAADRSKNEFLALLAHELRNPLAPLLNASQVLEAANADDAAVEQARDMMNRQIRNMARLIEDLLDVSRIAGGRIDLRRERVELATVLERAVGLTRHLIEARGQELSMSLPREPVHLDADPVRLEQVFGNLLNNASKFTLKGGHLWVTAELATDGVVVRVRDDGIGMAPETLPRVFDLFAQADRSSDRARGGLGIGLTVVQRLVELHDGNVEAHSAGPGEGSEFVVRLPVLPPANMEPERHGDAGDRIVVNTVLSVAVPPRRVLVVDDNVDTAESLALLLRLKGHEVETAHDGPAALERASSFHPEVVLLDIGLPGLDGYQVASRLRQQSRTAKALLVALTGYGQEEDQHLAREAGFDHHLTKPVDLLVIYELLARPASAKE
jgi:two-component system, chemotaxis family, CheB/CheR fusion protein